MQRLKKGQFGVAVLFDNLHDVHNGRLKGFSSNLRWPAPRMHHIVVFNA